MRRLNPFDMRSGYVGGLVSGAIFVSLNYFVPYEYVPYVMVVTLVAVFLSNLWLIRYHYPG